MIAANDNGRAVSPRNAATDIAALVLSGHVEAGGALPIQQRVQTSGRGEPQLPRWSEEGERAQRILGRGYAEGGEARRCALALWLLHAFGDNPASPLELGCVLTLTETERLARAREWTSWEHRGARGPAAEGARIIGEAVGWYETASEEPGGAGYIGELLRAADALHGSGGAWQRMKAEHKRACLAREKAVKGKAA